MFCFCFIPSEMAETAEKQWHNRKLAHAHNIPPPLGWVTFTFS